ncbi:MAG: Sec-independent protein translocase protein TatB [Actinomycetota bacterium]
MPSIGPLEIMVVAVIALIVFGPQRLPEIARSVGRALNELKRQASDIRSEFESGLDIADERDEPAEPDEPAKPKPDDPGTEEL